MRENRHKKIFPQKKSPWCDSSKKVFYRSYIMIRLAGTLAQTIFMNKKHQTFIRNQRITADELNIYYYLSQLLSVINYENRNKEKSKPNSCYLDTNNQGKQMEEIEKKRSK